MSEDFLAGLGLHLKDLVAGFAGGISSIFLFRKSDPWEVIGSIIVGGLAANYLGTMFSNFLGTPLLASAFAVGLAGMAICQTIANRIGAWDFLKGLKND